MGARTRSPLKVPRVVHYLRYVSNFGDKIPLKRGGCKGRDQFWPVLHFRIIIVINTF